MSAFFHNTFFELEKPLLQLVAYSALLSDLPVAVSAELTKLLPLQLCTLLELRHGRLLLARD